MAAGKKNGKQDAETFKDQVGKALEDAGVHAEKDVLLPEDRAKFEKAREDMASTLSEGEHIDVKLNNGEWKTLVEGKKERVQENLDGGKVADVLTETEEKETKVWQTSKFILKIAKDKYEDEVRPLDSYQRLSFIRGHMKPLPKVNKVHGVMKGDVDSHAEKINNVMEEE